MMGCSDEPVGYERPEELLIRHHIGVDEEPGSAASFAHPISLAAALLANALVSLRWALTEAAKLGTPKVGPLAWAIISAVLGGVAARVR